VTDHPQHVNRHSATVWLALFLVLIGTALRAAPLIQNRFHPDEALYATLARLIVSGRDPWLSQTPLLVDKPPLAYYTLAGFVALTGASELSVRLPSLFASVLSLALAFRLARQFWHRWDGALLSLLLMALSPFAILFAPTAFTDSLMTTGILAALSSVASRRWGWGGLWLGVSIAFKQSALFFIPLIALVGVIHVLMVGNQRQPRARWLIFFAALAACLVLMLGWDIARQPAPSFWNAAAAVNNPGRVARSAEVWPRALGWLHWLGYVTANPLADWFLVVTVSAVIPFEILLKSDRRRASVTLILVSFLLAYVAINWLVAFPILDRYLLPLIPLIALLVGRGASLIISRVAPPSFRAEEMKWAPATLLIVMFCVEMAAPALAASHSAYPVGGDHGPNDGIDQVAAWLDNQPYGTVIYARGLDWLIRYYMFDAYVFPVYLDTPEQFANDLHVFGASGPPRYLLLSAAETRLELDTAAAESGFRLTPALSPTGRASVPTMTLYRLDPLP